MVAVTPGSEPFPTRRTLERLQVEVYAKVTLKVTELSHFLMTNFALENIGIDAASFLADIVLTDTISPDVRG